MSAHSRTSIIRRLIAFFSLTSLGAAIALPATGMVANSGEVNQRFANNSPSQQLLTATPGINLIAQRGVSHIADELDTANDAFSTLSAAIRAAGLTSALAQRRPITIFAPIDQAFDALPAGTVQSLLRPENRARLTRILTYHVVPGNIDTFGLAPGSTLRLTTLAGQPLTIRVTDASQVFVNNVPVIMADIPATNGMIHGISAVLLP